MLFGSLLFGSGIFLIKMNA
ncbi:MAG TPA: sortase B protein-sorting domain-containing protein [Desulfobacterales bacterium]|nr:sortase B protein-sorting domain-containing protein [Desulfobacterales bacterium]